MNAFIGTGGYGYGVGSLSPAAQFPFGAMRLGPDTASSAGDVSWRHASGYNWADTFVRAFSHTRLVGAGVVDLGNVGVMPLMLDPEPEAGWRLADFGFSDAPKPEAIDDTPLAWWSLYERDSETASPGRYSVDLLGPNATAELLAIGTYAGVHRYSFRGAPAAVETNKGEADLPAAAAPALAVDVCHASAYTTHDLGDASCLNASFTLSSDGQSFDSMVHFKGSLSGGFVTAYVHGTLSPATPASGTVGNWTICDRDLGCHALAGGETVSSTSGTLFALGQVVSSSIELRVGLSFLSPSLARANLAVALDAVNVTTTNAIANTSEKASSDKNSNGNAIQGSNNSAPSFEDLVSATETVWCSALAGLSVSDSPGDPTLPTQLHSAHYRTHLSPTIYSEPASSNGEYTGLDQQLHSAEDDAVALGACPASQDSLRFEGEEKAQKGSKGSSADPASFEAWTTTSQAYAAAHFSDLSNWDIFRSVLPWLLLTQEPVAMGVMRSMAVMAQQQGAFPRWPLANHEGACMIGNHAASLLVDALLVFTDEPSESADSTMRVSSTPRKGAYPCGTWAAAAVAAAAAAQPALQQQATVEGAFMGRKDLAHYLDRGFVSFEVDDQAAVSTLTYAYDDYLLGILSQRLADLGSDANGGLDPDSLSQTAQAALERAANYQNVFSRENAYMCPRSNGTGNYSSMLPIVTKDVVDDDDFANEPLVCPVGATHVAIGSKYFREGDAWHYAFWAPHDVPGLVALHSSPQGFHDTLNDVMAKSTPNVAAGIDFKETKPNNYYWAGNEHNLLNPFLFNYGPNCSATQYWSRRMTELHYSNDPAGIPGNDDYGAMTTWLLFASLGFFPNAGTGGTFLIGAPRVANATIRLNTFAQTITSATATAEGASNQAAAVSNFTTLNVVAHNQGPGMYFVEKLLVDGTEWTSSFMPRSVLSSGPTLEFFLTSDPSGSGICPQST